MTGTEPVFDIIWNKFLPQGDGTQKVLDVGCGEHAWKASDYLAVQRGDIKAQKTKDDMFSVFSVEKKWPFKDSEFSVVVSTEVIEHIENPWFFIRESCRVAADTVIISTPNVHSNFSKALFERYDCFWGFTPIQRCNSQHISPIFKWQLDEMVKRANWKIDKVEFTDTPFIDKRLPPGIIPKDLLGVAATAPFHRLMVAKLTPG